MQLTRTPQGFLAHIRPNTSDEKVFKEIFVNEIYYVPGINFQVEENETWIDLGANCGYFTQYALEKGASVLAVDADPENAEIINKLKKYPKFLGLKQVAVVPNSYEKDHVKFFKRVDGMTWKSSLFKVAKSKEISVKAVTISNLLNQENLCLKMDIEGAEIPILKEGFDYSKINKMAFEWSFDKEPRISELKKVIQNLTKHFSKVHCAQNLETFQQTWQGKANQFALVFCKK